MPRFNVTCETIFTRLKDIIGNCTSHQTLGYLQKQPDVWSDDYITIFRSMYLYLINNSSSFSVAVVSHRLDKAVTLVLKHPDKLARKRFRESTGQGSSKKRKRSSGKRPKASDVGIGCLVDENYFSTTDEDDTSDFTDSDEDECNSESNIIHIISAGYLKDIFAQIPEFKLTNDRTDSKKRSNLKYGKCGSLETGHFEIDGNTFEDSIGGDIAVSPELTAKLMRLYVVAEESAYNYIYLRHFKEPYTYKKYTPIPKYIFLRDLLTSKPSDKVERYVCHTKIGDGKYVQLLNPSTSIQTKFSASEMPECKKVQYPSKYRVPGIFTEQPFYMELASTDLPEIVTLSKGVDAVEALCSTID